MSSFIIFFLACWFFFWSFFWLRFISNICLLFWSWLWSIHCGFSILLLSKHWHKILTKLFRLNFFFQCSSLTSKPSGTFLQFSESSNSTCFSYLKSLSTMSFDCSTYSLKVLSNSLSCSKKSLFSLLYSFIPIFRWFCLIKDTSFHISKMLFLVP